MRAFTDRAPGVQLVTDPYGRRVAFGPPAPPVAPFDFGEARPERPGLVALKGRINAGLAVQLLADTDTGETFITLVLNGSTETFPVPPEHALDAFEHPFVYGGTLPL